MDHEVVIEVKEGDKVVVFNGKFYGKIGHIASTRYKLQNMISGSSFSSKLQGSKSSPTDFVASTLTSSDSGWILDFGATHHLTNDNNNLCNNILFYGTNVVTVSNDACVPISHIGYFVLHRVSKLFLLSNVLHIPQANINLVSIHELCFYKCFCKVSLTFVFLRTYIRRRFLFKVFLIVSFTKSLLILLLTRQRLLCQIFLQLLWQLLLNGYTL